MDKDEALERVSKKLDIVIGLLIQLRARPKSEKDSVLSLQAAGLTVDEISRALGKSTNSIYLTLSRNRR